MMLFQTSAKEDLNIIDSFKEISSVLLKKKIGEESKFMENEVYEKKYKKEEKVTL